ncbi:hypothetical protein H2201_005302 [Coniosporium apollinis]|uniref:Ubiquitin-like domain-containing protein n=1 Tax=Coniosporium apollinis TaxID=61459 RepID=A0ABQ9NRL5_9PEZI|nr:hypothetical protein H2201_005302 [Coniosporium apollinis]
MADASEASRSAPSALLIDLKVVSPSTEIDEGGLNFPSLPAETTVGEVKLRVQDTVASHPTLDRQRFIYRGHVLADNDTTLLNVFGEQAIQQSRAQTLHLVLREPSSSQRPAAASASTPTSQSSTPAPNPFRSAMASPAGQPTNPFRPQPPGLRPQSQPPGPHAHLNPHPHPHPHHHHPLPPPFPSFFGAPPGGFPPIPPEINTILQQGFAAAQAHQQAHMHRPTPPSAPQQPNGASGPASTASPEPQQPQSTFQQFVNQQQQTRAAAGMQGVSSNNANDSSPQTAASTAGGEGTPAPIPGRTPTPRQNGSATPHPPPTTSSFTREMVGPNGERFVVTVNNTTMGMPAPNAMPAHGANMPQFPHVPDFAAGLRAGTPPIGLGLPPLPIYGNMPPFRRAGSPARSDRGDLQRIRANLDQAHRELESIRNLIQAIPRPADASPSPELTGYQNHIRAHAENLLRNLDQMQTSLNGLVGTPEYAQHRDIVSLQMLNNSLRSQAGGIMQNLVQPQPSPQPNGDTNHVSTSQAPNPTVTVSPLPPSTHSESSSNAQPIQNGEPSANTQPTSSQSDTNNPTTADPLIPAPVDGTAMPSTLPTIYLLCSPQGPHALVIGPTGQYTTPTMPWSIFSEIATAPSLRDVEAQIRELQYELYGYDPPPELAPGEPVLEQPQVDGAANAGDEDFQHIPLPWLNNPQGQPAAAPAPAPAPPQAPENVQPAAQPPRPPPGNAVVRRLNDLAIHPPHPPRHQPPPQLQPANADPNNPAPPQPPALINQVANNLWLLIRLLGFVYLFAGGSSWTRPALVALIGFGVWLMQIGFNGGWFEGIRRYWEELLAEAGGRGERDGGQPQPGAQTQAQAQDPTPERAAARLLADRTGNQRAWIGQQLRHVERAVALFIASFFPGMGERILAARDAAEAEEAVRIRVEQEQAEQRERETKEREEAEGRERGTVSERREGEEAGEGSRDTPAASSTGESNPTSTAKGKERAADVGEAAGGSSSALPGPASTAPDDDGARRRHEQSRL